MILILFLAVFSVVPDYANGHGNMMWPPSWFDPNGEIGLSPGGVILGVAGMEWAPPLSWFTNWTFIPGEPTINPSFFTVPDFHGDSYTVWDRAHCVSNFANYDICRAWYPINPSHNPWMAPGSAPVFSPCGIEGGNPFGCGDVEDDGECPGGGSSRGRDARDISWVEAVDTIWERGSNAEVGWAILANHGGGYSYRLCKVGVDGPGGVTEECFQKTPLKFASEDSWVQYGWDEGSRVGFKANRTTEGTYPPGSEWTMNPIPVCNSTAMGWNAFGCPDGTEFPPRAPGLMGTGEHMDEFGEFHAPDFLWTLMDEVEVPMELEIGEYVLSFRWDCEATPQIWNACSNIIII